MIGYALAALGGIVASIAYQKFGPALKVTVAPNPNTPAVAPGAPSATAPTPAAPIPPLPPPAAAGSANAPGAPGGTGLVQDPVAAAAQAAVSAIQQAGNAAAGTLAGQPDPASLVNNAPVIQPTSPAQALVAAGGTGG